MLFKACLLSGIALTVTAQFSTPYVPPSTHEEFLFLLQQQQQQQQPSDQGQPPSQPDQQPPLKQFSSAPLSPSPECLPVQSTSACAPWSNGFYINSTELTKIYALPIPITSDVWNTQVIQTTSGGEHQAAIWKNWSGCEGYKGELIQYSRSYVCLTDIFLFSAGCNAEQEKKLDICEGVCDAYGDAVGKLVDNEDICPKSEDAEVGKRREVLKNASKGCKTIHKKWNKPDTSKCSNGVLDDSTSCGFSGNQETKSRYCTENPTASCCLPTPIPLHSSSSLTSETSTSPSSSALPLGGIIGIAVSSLLLIVAIASAFIIRKRKRSRRPLVAPCKTGMSAVKSNSPTRSRELKTVSTAYQADMADELTLRVGDVVEVKEIYSDGWGSGTNVTTAGSGVFPTACLN